ncbi:hypothetical protein BZG02_01120 [Labilibaculum filiforme]|uniref:Peptidase M16 n=1 Tax=Labilibaculum filiforme TaxID=1940526 RepID=A0A2N3I5Q4_9BACT|nr:M16 family metallopeptidase [Labilibaculum filiforme]PKQ65635.1 hypothetical protein BZG02_01120 [Labilibaculum filiforme]
MKKLLSITVLLLFIATSIMAQTTSYKLKNGLTIILNEDHQQPSIYGCIVTKSGSKDDPSDATGLAHYLEHVLFKGTSEIGTTNWEQEKVHYDKIIALYDDLEKTTVEEDINRIQKEINEESLLAGKFTIANEFSNIIQSIGGTSLNAGTGFDMTQFYNNFPAGQLEAWLEIYSNRFVHPVFRGFQAELETVYEEKNMYSDSPFSVLGEEFNSAYYGEKTPYGRPIIGFTEHLKKPSLSKLIKHYEKFYVPGNMGLILSGDFNSENAKKLIENTFGKWDAKPLPIRKPITKASLNGNKKVKIKVTPIPVAIWGFPAVESGNKDEIALDIMCRLLSNNEQTGILDKYVIDGDIQNISVGLDSKINDGLLQILSVPIFDYNQLNFTPLSAVEKMIFKGIEELKSGTFEEWTLSAIQDKMCTDFELAKESGNSTGRILASMFASHQTIEDFDKYPTKVQSVTKDDILKVANEYLTDNYLSLFSSRGKAEKDKIEKPEIKPIEPSKGSVSDFSKKIAIIAPLEKTPQYFDLNKDITKETIADKVNLYYNQNSKNNVFSLTLKYGVGNIEIPTLDLATSLMNKAGIMAMFTPHELKKEFAKISCSYYFSNDENYTYVTLTGQEQNLAQACQLLSRTYILPALDDKQMDQLLGSIIGSRRMEKDEKDSQSSAIEEYLKYHENSPELTRLSNEDLKSLTKSTLTADFIKATQYETSIHYVGKKPFKEVKETLMANLAIPSGLKESNSPQLIEDFNYSENTIYFLNNSDARQSDVHLVLLGENFNLDQQPIINAFNQYFGGGFNGIVLQELRELRSFAYTAQAMYSTPDITNKPAHLNGYIGVQADKTADAVTEFIKLIRELPEKPERIENIRSYLVQATLSNKPSFRYLSQNIEEWQRLGYNEDPSKSKIASYSDMTFNDILDFYKKNIQNKPIAIAIVGNKKLVDIKKLEEIAKITYLNPNKIFKD